MARNSNDKVAVAVGSIAFAAAGAWLYTQHKAVDRLRDHGVLAAQFPDYAPKGGSVTLAPAKEWSAPPHQSAGAEWLYDVFTPPVIFYNDGKFVVNPVTVENTAPAEVPPFGVSLVAVRKNEFSLQLIGYVGTPGNYLGTFENIISGEAFLGRAGTSVPALGLTIQYFNVAVESIELPENMPLYEVVATARVVDAQGREIVITNRERKENGPPIASIKVDGSDDLRDVQVGDKFLQGDIEFVVQEVNLATTSVIISKNVPNKDPEVKTLSLGATSAAATQAPASGKVASPFGF